MGNLLDYSSERRGFERIAPLLSYGLAMSVLLGLLALAISVRPDWRWVVGLTTVGGGTAATMAAVGLWRSRTCSDTRRNAIAMIVGFVIVVVGPVIVRLDTPFYRQPVYNVRSLPGLRQTTQRSLTQIEANRMPEKIKEAETE